MSTSTWNIDTAHSGISFTVRHMVVSKVRGKFADWKGTLTLDEEHPAQAVVEVAINAASIETGVADRDNHLRSADFLDAAQYPQIAFRSTAVKPAAKDRFKLSGDLTIRGVTRPVSLDVEFGGRAQDPWGNLRAGYSARVRLERKDFGLQWNQLLEAGGVLVGEQVDVEIELEAVKAAATAAA
ncbi:MAG: YceI family protein [Candidatus Lambdaproteobacteria bacterium]|nr:YceI family protein [Candidatus Lambdaproteobacteria bacterium]